MNYKGKIIGVSMKQITKKDGTKAPLLTIKVQSEEGKSFFRDYWIPMSTPAADSQVEKSFCFFFKTMETVGLVPTGKTREILDSKEINIKKIYQNLPQFKKIKNGEDGVNLLKDSSKVFEIVTEMDGQYEKIKYINDPENPVSTGGEKVTAPEICDMFGDEDISDEIPF